ncbi:GNAT family N-acetyltransferase [Halobacillus karajensis]|uniref:Pseudaminic acid biosynthesis N-acetyl transferase n=1 Tax=Halobacillus karajensis TaxID=195088 RepID=A0A024P540_9BACI|nr:GNAT family protein [Halobacillus karajensis]CDQ20536.1 pseudaminic acid biosynthesis N-acetyl transferase [Halobacillus karajensis]CDQ23995.1 pseudaminic acid biosynthesis N-acetyl transferase [Halobacillus karajensis]CDQ27473.1 pseudaminic acid biosynthesis N-acetyl transferase [Halobacillus karajensis]
MDVAITEIKRCHLDVLHEWERDEKLQVQTGVDVPRTYEQFLHAYKAYLNGEKPNLYLRAVLLDGQLIGKVELFRTTEKDFIGMVIAEKRNSGVGTRALFLFLDEIYERFGIKHVFAEVYEDNTRSLHFFKKNGFQTTGEKKREWFRGKPRELITMKKDLQ